MDASAHAARAAADRLLASGVVDDPVVREGSVGEPLPVRARDGSPAGWIVPILAGEHLLAFLQFDAAMAFLRCSRLPRRTLAAAWLDPDHARRAAEARFPAAAPAGAPFLSFDGNITRLAWAVPARGGVIFVMGDYAYTPSARSETTG